MQMMPPSASSAPIPLLSSPMSVTPSGTQAALADDQQNRKWTDAEMSRLLKSYYLAMTQPPPPGATWETSASSNATGTGLVKFENREQLFDQVCRFYSGDLRPTGTGLGALWFASVTPSAEFDMLVPGNGNGNNTPDAMKRRTPKSLLEKFKFLRMTYFFILDYDKRFTHLPPGATINYDRGIESGSAWWKLGVKEQRDLLSKSRTPMSLRVFVLMHGVMTRIEAVRSGDATLQPVQSQSVPSAQQQLSVDDSSSRRKRQRTVQPVNVVQSTPTSLPQGMPAASSTANVVAGAGTMSNRMITALVEAVERNTRAVERMTNDNAGVAAKLDELTTVLREIKDVYVRNSV
ncbi:hypothetical protein V1517DRAFT_365339 [Lipomyces orientalis]|uniref:Uncharacterized protein n=1 Tax=Lipomyces orientalis TaxID=1233043 RepID=A0ACC3TWI4_9ASCO